MSDQDATIPTNASTAQRDPDAIREEINQTREDMGETLDALTAKLDMKSQAKAKADQAKAQAKATADQAKTMAQDLAGQAKDQAQTVYRQQPKVVIAGAAAIIAILIGVLIRRARR
jgi:ElaB/YqjD/DUF883 family membrane-anchored ribosome-binding protein